jgi:glutaminyl-tRNA synthetase
MCDRLFAEAHTDAGGKDFLPSLNPDSLNVMTAYVEPSLAGMQPDQKLQFEQHEYFVADRLDHVAQHSDRRYSPPLPTQLEQPVRVVFAAF